MKIIKTLMLVMVMLSSTLCAQAQAQNVQAQGQRERQRLTREQLAERQAYKIAHEMAFDDATTKKFVEAFCQYHKEMWTICPKPEPRCRQRQMSDSETEEEMKQHFDRSQKMLDLRKKYHAVYSKFLTPKQVSRVYELEREMMKRCFERHEKQGKGHGAKAKGRKGGHGRGPMEEFPPMP